MSKPILLVEDEEHDVIFMRMALERAEVKNPLLVVGDGREAIAYLNGDGKYCNRDEYPLPVLVLLDLRLPQIPGLEVLKWIRLEPTLSDVHVIVCSSSGQDSDVDAARHLGASAYVVKPSRPTELLEIVRRIKKCWLDCDGSPPTYEVWLSMTFRS